ncbi:AmmeMemoRadiSam system protein B, variant [Verruconis gallopava]|uniref:AmmeMemoRadiSam system protein B, variant n=1 Tax=Verruconis gallopava TaxID=253628 RepID=A0A0D1Z2H9_9PEZI|nr:AmmeMemoRadiSam system protein B, variant [Verruconis gallopava]KIW07152.1 AmmeMemoRadiSam system protein B, variant [Verruconis gallopava]
MMTARRATHAGSWYTDDERELSGQLDSFLAAVPSKTACIGTQSAKEDPVDIPVSNARAIIAPHAGYSYSGPAAAWAYKAVDWSNVKRVFLLGPSHHYYLETCALSRCTTYETPLGDLKLDMPTIAELEKTGKFSHMSRAADEDEHSLEMHLPYIYKMLSRNFASPADFPPLIPILVGSTNRATEKAFGALLAPYLADPSSIFIASSDFCHWGSRFRYTYYQPASGPAVHLNSAKRPSDRAIHESIAAVDMQCIDAVETGVHDEFLRVLEETGNTVCGRHPIGVVMAAVEVLEKEGKADPAKGQGRFKFVRYERSSLVTSPRDSSVSYCSAFAVL